MCWRSTSNRRGPPLEATSARVAPAHAAIAPQPESPEEEIFRALVLGTRDYARKCRFSQVLLGLSGGIDSALTAVIAAEALGAEHVLGVLMPSPYSSAGSVDDSLALAQRLGIRTLTLPIEPLMTAFDGVLAPAFAGYPQDITEENIQARARGNLLMAISNKFGALLLTTGNKSELSVGYCTLYGDMSGGLAVIADVPKTMVYRVSEWVNAHLNGGVSAPVIPEAILTKAPSAELRPNQTDQDSLPPYDVLDEILERHIERYESADTIVAAGFDADDRAPRAAPRAPRRVQAASGRARAARHRARVRHRLAHAGRARRLGSADTSRPRLTRYGGSVTVAATFERHSSHRRVWPIGEGSVGSGPGWCGRHPGVRASIRRARGTLPVVSRAEAAGAWCGRHA